MSEIEQMSQYEGAVSLDVVEAVADREGVEPADLPPLYEWIDPDALDDLFAPTNHRPGLMGQLTFRYCGYLVTVFNDGELGVEIEDPSLHGRY